MSKPISEPCFEGYDQANTLLGAAINQTVMDSIHPVDTVAALCDLTMFCAFALGGEQSAREALQRMEQRLEHHKLTGRDNLLSLN